MSRGYSQLALPRGMWGILSYGMLRKQMNSVLGSTFWQQRELVNFILPNSSFSQIYLTTESVFQNTSYQPVVLMEPF